MHKKSSCPARTLAALIWVAGLQGCATTTAPAPATTPFPVAPLSSEHATASKEAMTVDNLLRWPLEGPAGVAKAGTELHRKFPDFKPLPPADLQRDGPMRLADGYILSFVWIRVPTESLSIGLESEPCFPPKRAAEISGAALSPVFQDAHGIDRGRHYDAKGNGVRIRFTTTPETYRCVTSIQVHPIDGTETPSPMVSPASKSAVVSKDMITVENLLRWPLEGPAGVARTGAELRRTFPVFKPLPPADFLGNGPMQLADGYVLSFVLIGGPSESLSIGLESEPCLTPAQAAEISKATLNPVFQDAHGVDRGRSYDADGNGVRINFTTTPETYRCVDSIQAHLIKRTGR
ncbi:hypothetical protein [Lysobacter sp. Root559]|uniref:hypothetical protein n=1 Tax=Lysobacter sp. Root559 TaxID=1736559 RepID=UPI000B064EBC|nr:hypothetical protein [Lysobacter sp. Root559]